jgi:hypothetical protein
MGAVGNLSYRDAVIVARQFTAWGLCENKTRPVGYGVIGGSETGSCVTGLLAPVQKICLRALCGLPVLNPFGQQPV